MDPNLDIFLQILDGFIETAHEFIGDDGLDASLGYINDIAATEHIRQTYTDAFQDGYHPGLVRNILAS